MLPKLKPAMLAMAILAIPISSQADPWQQQTNHTAAFLPETTVSADAAEQVQGKGWSAVYSAVASAANFCSINQCQNWYELADGYFTIASIAYDAYRDWRKKSSYRRMDPDDFVRAWMRAEGVRIPRGYVNY